MNTKYKVLLMALVTLTLVIAGCNGEAPVTPQTTVDPAKTVESPKQPAVNPTQEKTMQIVVYHATKDAMYLVPETHKVAINNQPARTAIELLLAGTKNSDLVAIMPAGTKLKNLTVKDHIAYVDFDDAIIKKSTGGSAGETLMVAAIVNTLTEFSDIHQVQILINGKKVETLSGHLDVSEPLGRSERIIKK